MEIVEVGPRDGLQNEKRVLSTGTKVEYVRRAIDEGTCHFEWIHMRRDGTLFHADVLLNSVDALHGDLGIVTDGDLVLALS